MSAGAAFYRVCWSCARARLFSAAAGANAARRDKPDDGRATKLFFARCAFAAYWRCSEGAPTHGGAVAVKLRRRRRHGAAMEPAASSRC